MPMLDVDRLSVRYGTKQIVDALSFSVSEGQWLMIAGPNGAGKSTALAAITQGTPYTGRVLFEGQNVRSMKPALRARAIGVLAQNHFVGYGFTVEEVVRLGRFAYAGGVFGRSQEDDAGHVEQALTLTGLQDKRRQSVLTLSGGELQRTFLAQVLAQDPKLLLLDEPTNHLDLIYQKQIFALIGQWLQKPGRAVVSVVHDLSLARAFGTDALLMDSGRKIALGRANDVLTPANLDRVYGMDVAAWMRGLYRQWAEYAAGTVWRMLPTEKKRRPAGRRFLNFDYSSSSESSSSMSNSSSSPQFGQVVAPSSSISSSMVMTSPQVGHLTS